MSPAMDLNQLRRDYADVVRRSNEAAAYMNKANQVLAAAGVIRERLQGEQRQLAEILRAWGVDPADAL